MKKIKIFIKKHKKEIVVGSIAAAGTAAFFLIKEKKANFGVSISMRVGDYERWDENSRIHSSINLHNPDMYLGDLGEIGAKMIKMLPGTTAETKISNFHIDHTIFEKVAEEVLK